MESPDGPFKVSQNQEEIEEINLLSVRLEAHNKLFAENNPKSKGFYSHVAGNFLQFALNIRNCLKYEPNDKAIIEDLKRAVAQLDFYHKELQSSPERFKEELAKPLIQGDPTPENYMKWVEEMVAKEYIKSSKGLRFVA